jgi:hypothetical protein
MPWTTAHAGVAPTRVPEGFIRTARQWRESQRLMRRPARVVFRQPRRRPSWRLIVIGVLLAAIALELLWRVRSGSLSHVLATEAPPPHIPVPIYTGPDKVTGTMGGRSLAIPRFYLLSEAQYRDAAAEHLTLRSFAICLRLSNFEPVRSARDLQDWSDALARPDASLYEVFTTIGVYANDELGGRHSLQSDVASAQADASPTGPFHLQADRVAGLAHAISDRRIDFTPSEFYYDDAGWKTEVVCTATRRQDGTPAAFDDCQLKFPVPEINATAVADITKKDLLRWQDLESATRDLVHSFMVAR